MNYIRFGINLNILKAHDAWKVTKHLELSIFNSSVQWFKARVANLQEVVVFRISVSVGSSVRRNRWCSVIRWRSGIIFTGFRPDSVKTKFLTGSNFEASTKVSISNLWQRFWQAPHGGLRGLGFKPSYSLLSWKYYHIPILWAFLSKKHKGK